MMFSVELFCFIIIYKEITENYLEQKVSLTKKI